MALQNIAEIAEFKAYRCEKAGEQLKTSLFLCFIHAYTDGVYEGEAGSRSRFTENKAIMLGTFQFIISHYILLLGFKITFQDKLKTRFSLDG